LFFSSGARAWGFHFYKELLPCGEKSESFLLRVFVLRCFSVCVVFFQFPGPLEPDLPHTVVVPGRCCVGQSYNRSGLPGRPLSVDSYLASPALTLLKEAAASLVFMAAAGSDLQPTIMNHVIILRHCLRLCMLKTASRSSSLSGMTSADGCPRWKCQGQSRSRAGMQAALPSWEPQAGPCSWLLSPFVSFVNPVSSP